MELKSGQYSILVLVTICWFCGPTLAQNVIKASELKSRSIDIPHKSEDFEVLVNPDNSALQLVFSDSTYCFQNNNLSNFRGTYPSAVKFIGCSINTDSIYYDSVVFAQENCQGTRKVYYPNIVDYQGLIYRPFVIKNRNIAFQEDGAVWIYLLKESAASKQPSYTEHTSSYNNSRLGKFKVINDTLRLCQVFNFFPTNNFLSHDNRFILIYPLVISDGLYTYIGYNFLDTFYRISSQGICLDAISLPQNLPFTYYRHGKNDPFDAKQNMIAQRQGTQNFKFFYNKQNKCLHLVTIEGDTGFAALDSLKPIDKKNWFFSTYDIEKGQWIQVIQFSQDYNFRNVIVSGDKLFVARTESAFLVYDVFHL